MNIILAGMPGCGKTTVTAVLAEKLGYKSVDTDVLIVEKYGEISKIFADFGEEYFREIESEVVKNLTRVDNTVIATGGGCLINPQNVATFRSCGKIVYLKTSIDELARRLSGDTSRPLLQGDAKANLENLYARRAHIYEAAADCTVDTDGVSPDKISDKIIELIRNV